MDDLRVAIVIGSNRSGRFGPTVGRWFAARVEEHEGLRPDVIDLGELDLPTVLGLPDDDRRLSGATEALE